MPQVQKKAAGFTLIEILISISIISLVGIVFFPNLRRFNNDQQYQNEVLDLKNAIKNAQNMSTTGTRCSSTKASLSWSTIITPGTTIGTSLRASCITTALVSSVENYPGITAANTTLLSSSCAVGTTSIELKFDKNGFSYTCTPGGASGTTFNLQLQNKNNTTQTTTISINKLGSISQN